MNSYSQLLVSIVVIFIGVLIILFRLFFEKANDSNQEVRTVQNIGELRKTDFSQTARVLKYIYIGLVIAFLLVVYFLVPHQRLG